MILLGLRVDDHDSNLCLYNNNEIKYLKTGFKYIYIILQFQTPSASVHWERFFFFSYFFTTQKVGSEMTITEKRFCYKRWHCRKFYTYRQDNEVYAKVLELVLLKSKSHQTL